MVGGEAGVGAVCVSCWICSRWPWGSGVVRIVVGFAILIVGAPRDQKNENMRFLSFVSEAAIFRTRKKYGGTGVSKSMLMLSCALWRSFGCRCCCFWYLYG